VILISKYSRLFSLEMAMLGAGDCPRKLIGAVDQGTSSSRFLVCYWSTFYRYLKRFEKPASSTPIRYSVLVPI